MINPRDLMIGNILQRIDMQNKMSPCLVIKIDYKSIDVRQGSCIFEVADLDKTRCCPIPITEKILLDSGFEDWTSIGDLWQTYALHNVVDGTSDFKVMLQDGDYVFCVDSNSMGFRELKHIHNLQNAFRLATGEDLEIVING
jgi:hypothetical protein